MENQTLLRNFAWLCFISNTLCVLILIDLILFKKPYFTLFTLIFSLTFYSNYKFFLFFRKNDAQKKLAKKTSGKLFTAFFGIYFSYLFSLLLPEVTHLLTRLEKKS